MGYTTGIRWTIEKIRDYIKLFNYTLLDNNYINSNTKLNIVDNQGYLYCVLFENFKKHKIPSFVHKNNPYSIQNIKLYCNINQKPFVLLSNNYINSKEKLFWKCKNNNCKETFECNWDNISQGKGCPYCSGHQVGMSNCLATKNPELALEWHPTKNVELTPYDVTSGSGKKVWWQCENGHEWKTAINIRNSLCRNCPECAESMGEKEIKKVLKNYNIPHDFQYTFNDLIGIGGSLLRFDIPVFWDKEKTQLRCLIEYDGIFHYEKQYDEDGYETLQIHDKLKDEYCKNNNIPLLRIPYWDFDRIEEILKIELN